MRFAIGVTSFDLAYEALQQGKYDLFVGPQGIIQSEFAKVLSPEQRARMRRVASLKSNLTAADKLAIATDFAEMMVDKTAFQMSRENRMRLARGIGAPIMTFRTYPLYYLEMLSSLPPKHQFYAIASLFFLAGLGGLPFAEDLEDILDTIMEWLGSQPKFTERWLRATGRAVLDPITDKEELKQSVMDFVAGGVSEAGIPGVPHFQASVSAGNILPGTTLLMPSEDKRMQALGEFFGVGAKQLESALNATTNIANGQGYMGLRAVVPRGVKMWMMSGEQLTYGTALDPRGAAINEVDKVDAFWQFVGFGAYETRKLQDFARDFDSLLRYRELRANTLKGRIAKAVIDEDSQELTAAWDQVNAWNESYPEWPITVEPRSLKTRIKTLTVGLEARLEERTPEALRPTLIQRMREGSI